jgi:hypothetical protein
MKNRYIKISTLITWMIVFYALNLVIRFIMGKDLYLMISTIAVGFIGLIVVALVFSVNLGAKDFCKHHYQGKVMNGSGGCHIWCDKCEFEYWGSVYDPLARKIFDQVQNEKDIKWQQE